MAAKSHLPPSNLALAANINGSPICSMLEDRLSVIKRAVLYIKKKSNYCTSNTSLRTLAS
jgi:hypothetical protein